MRVISGKLGGRQFDSPKSRSTHPMSEKMRGALFNILGDIEGLTVFDAYGGSGALVFEAISLGAKQAVVCEIDKNATKVIENSIRKLDLAKQIALIKQNSASWADNNDQKFDLVLCDPPYDDIKEGQLAKIAQSVKRGGLFILSAPNNSENIMIEGFIVETKKKYGKSSLSFYRKK